MPDREKTIKGLRHCLHYNGSCLDCPYDGPNCQNDVLDDAINLLKEQEAKPVKVVKNAYNHEFYYCPRCDRSFYELYYGKPKFCDKCGQEITWNG